MRSVQLALPGQYEQMKAMLAALLAGSRDVIEKRNLLSALYG